ncbi:DUF4376 domain-containing protein [Ochrobactrum sp. MR34]|nr:DUF4376 domain-containing protein [Ochrobactrum sp. MR34]
MQNKDLDERRFYIKTNPEGFLVSVFDTIYYQPAPEQIEGFTEVDRATFDELYQNQQTRRYVNGKVEIYTPPPTSHELRSLAAQKRWEKEVGGITLSGLVVHTDDRSKIMISGARVAAEADRNFTTQWKGADGSFVTLDAAMIVAISNAVSNHVSNCFALEAQVLAQIEAGTITTATEIDAAFA